MQLSFAGLAALVVAAATTAVEAVKPNPSALMSANFGMIGRWGFNQASSMYTDDVTWEPSLYSFCQSTSYEVYHIGYVKAFRDANGYPGLHLGNHCYWPNNAFPNWKSDSETGFYNLNCPSVASDIALCQNMGKKVMISFSPNDFIGNTTADNGAVTAKQLWDLYLGGSSPYRPFGTVVLDGIDIHAWNNDPNSYSDMIKTLRALMDASPRTFWLSGSPRCDYPDWTLGPNNGNRTDRILTTAPNAFDFLTPWMTASPNICGFAGNNPSGFWTQLRVWNDLAASLGIPMFPGLPTWYVEAFDQAATGDYINSTVITNTTLVTQLKTLSQFRGVSLDDASYDRLNTPCIDTKLSYSHVWYRKLMNDSWTGCLSSGLEYSGKTLVGGGVSTTRRINTIQTSGSGYFRFAGQTSNTVLVALGLLAIGGLVF
ncbi:hypothetical protein CXG81DRAFT_18363 [Caulochytrium protostelioides]|uniref:Glycoside hydrolase n=1 Tax=Caulochytrium protostelioides TaxID=1555241 RepID=A0A4P9X9C2_9FUNG|nr:glycoside hydrolase [Caulochytrium protostelioides]RKP01934.1 hypothetical protein CXG81DRAFT_18363 [Caulochytrium protostelioides]|eukprot:RKP01934.1 hypothetical protein CXG81DRAFT_18363 [Caulochytrium protostelioides]